MAVLQESTREEQRVNVGYLLGAIKELEADASGSTTTFLTDDIAIVTADDPNGKWLVFTSGTNDGSIRQVTDSTVSSNQVTLTFHPAVAASTADADTAELWDQWYDPAAIHNFLNQAQKDATGYVFDPVEDITLHSGGRTRFDIPANRAVIYGIDTRVSMTSKVVTQHGELWNESTSASFTVTQDDEDRLYGVMPAKMVVSGGSNGDLTSISIAANDLSNMTHIEFGIKVDVGVAANDLVLRLSATANGADTDKIIIIPALTAGEETWVRVAMTEAVSSFTPSEATAIISVALEYNANIASNTIWVTGVDATDENKYDWELLDTIYWDIDKQARDLVLIRGGDSVIGYRLIKLKGGDVPTLLTADTTVTEVPESYITYHAAGLALRRPIRGESSEDARARLAQSNDYMGIAAGHKRNFPILRDARFTT